MKSLLILSVRLTGLEPARRETLDPKSSASTNSATGANALIDQWICRLTECGCKGTKKIRNKK